MILLWEISIAATLVVSIVVAILLALILRQAAQIEDVAAQIWTAGKLIANNTILITLLVRTNQVVEQILGAAGGIAAGTARIQTHAQTCTGCPACVLGPPPQARWTP